METDVPQTGWKIDEGTFWLPKQASTLAETIDFGWDMVLWISVFFFILVVVPMVLFVVKYRRKHPDEIGAPTGHNTALEIVWTVIPLAVVMACFLVGFKGYMEASVPPAESYQIAVTAKKWAWSFTYPEGHTVTELRVPKGRNVKLLMSSQDVIHSLFIPEFRVKQDVVPGSYTTVWFNATEAKETTLLCTEYCGTAHSAMLAKVIVQEEADFAKWIEEQSQAGKGLPPEEFGKQLFTAKGCNACHSVEANRLVGPPFKGLFGKDEPLVGGGTVKVDENYLRESILDPAAKVVDTYPPIMPSYKGQVKDQEIDAIIAYIKTLK